MDKKSLPKEEVKLPKPEIELPKPETDLPLPEKNLPKSKNVKASSPEEVLPMPASSFQPSYMWLKLLALTLVLILIFISGFMLLQNNSTKTLPPSPSPTKTVDETANWKTYSDPKFNISFMYPPNWDVIASNSGFTLNPLDKKQNKDYINYPPISISFENNPNNLSLEKWQEEKNAPDSGNQVHNYISPKTEKTTINGNPAYINKIGATCEPSGCYEVFILGNGKIWILKNYDFSGSIPVGNYPNGQFKVLYTKNDIQANQKIFDLILSTFKFTDQNPQADTSTWKTYVNNKYGFILTFPAKGKNIANKQMDCGNHIVEKNTSDKNAIIYIDDFFAIDINKGNYNSIQEWTNELKNFIIRTFGNSYSNLKFTINKVNSLNADEAGIISSNMHYPDENLPFLTLRKGDVIYNINGFNTNGLNCIKTIESKSILDMHSGWDIPTSFQFTDQNSPTPTP